ncbi:hypothetical protein D9V84_03340 [Bacteroidetes/Chlorobi group bacterium Naka2016]|jgi:cytochrome c|nr:MAG: hypothetical protein D9V84_03340 [Bacteroidetes/Chlorobi group bacterium Naka2016]
MEALNVIAIPHTEQVLKLLEILFFLGFSIFTLYFAFLFGASSFAIYYYLRGISKNDDYYLTVSKNYVNYFGKGYVAFIGLGLVPILAVYYALLQFIQKAPDDFFLVLFVSVGLFIVYVVVSKILLLKSSKIAIGNRNLLFVVFLGILSLISLVVSFLTIGVFNLSVSVGFQLTPFTIVDLLSFNTIIRFLFFIAIAFIITPLTYIFKTYSVDEVTEKGNYFIESKPFKQNLTNILIAFYLLPIIYFLMYLQMPKNLVTLQNFILVVSSILVLLLCGVFTYFSLKESKVSFAKYAFVTALVSFILIFASDTSLLAVSNKVQQFKIAKEYITYHEQLLASAGRQTGEQINGEEIYKAKCVACHQFDTKLVGPPHKEVLKKYENRKEDMVKFILNPVKVDPNYPPMPNQGLKPKEAEAVVNYMFEHYGPMLK